MTGSAVPVVDYLVLDGGPYLVAQECTACGALFLDRRSGCARCSGIDFRSRRLAETGRLRTFTVVHRAPPPVETPFVVGVVDLDGGGTVKANITGVRPDPEDVKPDTAVRLTTFVAGTAPSGAAIVSFAFEPD